jgi:hemoglobin/transferrin/lactoferrin receptor protein
MQYIKCIQIVICTFLIISTGNAQIVKVMDRSTGLPLEGVTISTKDNMFAVYSDKDGTADISNLITHSSALTISFFGYQSIEISATTIDNNNPVIILSPIPFDLDQIVVSATKWSQSSMNLPQKVSSLKAKDIAFQNPQTAADLLGFSGNVFIQKSQQGGGSPMIRGFATNRLLYAIDGVRMNTAIFRAGNIQNVISLDAFATESAEILFGPGSVIYGSDAIGGVMAFQTLTPKFSGFDKKISVNGNATFRHSTANAEKTGHFDLNIGSKKFASVTSVTYNDFGDLRMGSYGPEEYLKKLDVVRQGNKDVIVVNKDSLVQVPSEYSQLNLMQKFRYAINKSWDLQYALHYSETSEYSRYDRHIRYRNGLPRYGEWKYGPQKWLMNHLTVTNDNSTALYDRMSIRMAHQRFEESRIDREINKATRHIKTEKVDAYSLNVDLSKSTSEQGKINYGIESVINDVQSTGKDEDVILNIISPGAARYPQATWSSYAAYINYDHRFSDKVNVQAGSRYNHFSLNAVYDTTFYPIPFTDVKSNNGSLTGSIGVVYRPHMTTALMVNLSTGFRAPNVDDSGKVFDPAEGFVTVPNPNLKAEYAYNAEIGVVKVISNIIRVDLNLYYTRLTDALVKRPFQLNGLDSILYNGIQSKVEAIQNAASATVKGCSAGVEIKAGHGLSLISKYNIQSGEEELDNGNVSPSRHAATNFGTTMVSWTKNKMTVALSAVYSDGKTFDQLPEEEQNKPEIYAKGSDSKPYSPSWTIFNIKSSIVISKYVTVQAGVENITDLRYRPYSSGIVAPGRNFIFSASVKF